MNEKIQQRIAQIGIEGYVNEANPVLFWDLYGREGHPVRTTVSEIGPTLLGRILALNDTQAWILEITLELADDRGLLLLDLDDLRALLGFIADNRKKIFRQYGLVSTQSIAAIRRALLILEREGGETVFGEPAMELGDLMRTDLSGRGIINILAANQLILKPRLYSSFLLWLLSELFENLPEVGDLERPKLVFFFKEKPSEHWWQFLIVWLWGTKRRQGLVETLAKQTARTVGRQIGRQILRGMLGGISGGSRSR